MKTISSFFVALLLSFPVAAELKLVPVDLSEEELAALGLKTVKKPDKVEVGGILPDIKPEDKRQILSVLERYELDRGLIFSDYGVGNSLSLFEYHQEIDDIDGSRDGMVSEAIDRVEASGMAPSDAKSTIEAELSLINKKISDGKSRATNNWAKNEKRLLLERDKKLSALLDSLVDDMSDIIGEEIAGHLHQVEEDIGNSDHYTAMKKKIIQDYEDSGKELSRKYELEKDKILAEYSGDNISSAVAKMNLWKYEKKSEERGLMYDFFEKLNELEEAKDADAVAIFKGVLFGSNMALAN